MANDQVASREARLALKDTHQQQRLRPMRHLLSHRTKLRQVAAITTLRKLKTTSQLAQLAPRDTRHNNDHRLDQDSRDRLEVDHPTQELKLLQVVRNIPEHKVHQLVPTQQLVRLNDQVQAPPSAQPLPNKVSDQQLNRDRPAEASDQDLKAAAVKAVLVRHRQANKMTAKRAITLQFPENPTLTTQSTRKFQKLRSTASSKSSLVITLTLRPAVKCSTSAL